MHAMLSLPMQVSLRLPRASKALPAGMAAERVSWCHVRPERRLNSCKTSRTVQSGCVAGRTCAASESTSLENMLSLLRSKRSTENRTGPGRVFLVGTGPGDPGLLTIKSVQLMQSADVILYDRLVSDDILRLVSPSARMVYVGKHSGFHTRTQEEIHELLLQFAEAGAMVVRLKGGDPYVFGRGGEEMQYLTQRGISVHCVPGITAAAGICAELDIPMTHRGVATSARFLTGHSREGGEEALDESISDAVDAHTTLIVYMGLATLPSLSQRLIANGLPADTPAAAIERGTTPDQRVVFGRLSQLSASTKEAGLKSPTLMIIGQVVAVSPSWQDWEARGQPLVWYPAAHGTGSEMPHQDPRQPASISAAVQIAVSMSH